MANPSYRCPRCGSGRVARIVYGMPAWSQRLERDLAAGRVVLAGCLLTEGAPVRQCAQCGHGFGAASEGPEHAAQR